MTEERQEHHIGPPRLVNYTCEVSTTENKVPHCLLTMDLEDKTFQSSSSTKTVKLQLKASTLDTLLGSFDKIKTQLASFDEKL